MTLPHVVIVGGGFGGLAAARALRNTQVSVTLIDKRNYHLFRPMLYQVATGLLSADEISGPLRSIVNHQNNIDVLMDEVTGINTAQRIVRLTRGELLYDFLILATGIRYNYFGHDEWQHFASGLESLDDADITATKFCVRSSERKKWPRSDRPGLRTLAASSPLRSWVRERLGLRWPAHSPKCRAWLWHMISAT
jgi:NADH dehydrogenase FAD-containing subunit